MKNYSKLTGWVAKKYALYLYAPPAVLSDRFLKVIEILEEGLISSPPPLLLAPSSGQWKFLVISRIWIL